MNTKIELKRANGTHPGFILLVQKLDDYLAVQNGDQHAFFDQYNKLNLIHHAVVVYLNDQPVACGAFKEIEPGTIEIKRMFTLPEQRRKGYSKRVLDALHAWAKELGYQRAVLETASRFEDAVALYRHSGYQVIPNYGQYSGIAESTCMAIELK